jgi:hypothetical protein
MDPADPQRAVTPWQRELFSVLDCYTDRWTNDEALVLPNPSGYRSALTPLELLRTWYTVGGGIQPKFGKRWVTKVAGGQDGVYACGGNGSVLREISGLRG